MADRNRIRLRERARQDVEAAVDSCRDEADDAVALRLVDVLQFALDHVGQYEGLGSARYSLELGIPALRCWQLEGFPYLVFYVEGMITSMCGACCMVTGHPRMDA